MGLVNLAVVLQPGGKVVRLEQYRVGPGSRVLTSERAKATSHVQLAPPRALKV